MKSIALYIHHGEDYHGEDYHGNTVELHINIWKVKQGLIRIKDLLYIDFGIKFSSKCDKFLLYLPFKIKDNQVEDLGKSLVDSRELLNAVFNEDMLCTPSPNHSFSEVKINGNKNNEVFYIYTLGHDNMNVEYFPDEHENQVGTILTITTSGNPNNEENENNDLKYYIRFRIQVEDKKEVVKTEHLSNDLLQAAFSKTDMFDIRINEKREIPAKVEERSLREGYTICTFSKVHLFYIVDAHESISNGGQHNSRLLEENQWCSYEPECNVKGINYMAYHWKDKENDNNNPLNSFSLFFNTLYPKVSPIRLVAYFSVVVLFGWIGSMLSFKPSELFKDNTGSWIRLIIVFGIILFILIFIIVCNFVVKWIKINRKV